MGGQGTPSPLSPTPSPAGSVGSVGSQSSGYSSGELRGGQAVPSVPSQQPPLASCGPCIAVPLSIHRDMQIQNQHFSALLASHDLWEQADNLVFKSKLKGEIISLKTVKGPANGGRLLFLRNFIPVVIILFLVIQHAQIDSKMGVK